MLKKESMKKKENIFYLFKNIIEKSSFIGFLSVSQYDVKNHIHLKRELEVLGFKVKVVKNKVFSKVIKTRFSRYKNMVPLVQGFCIIIYPIEFICKVSTLKMLALFLKKNNKYIFLGGLLEDRLINSNYFKFLLELKEIDQIFSEIYFLINRSNTTLVNTLLDPSKNLVNILRNKEE